MNKLKMLRERLAAIGASLKGFQAKSEYSEEDKKQIAALQTEAVEVQNSIKFEEDLEKTMADLNKPATTPVSQAQPGAADVRVIKNSFEDKTGFKSPGHFFMAVREAAHGKVNERLNNAIYDRDDEGGILVPDDISTVISKAISGDASLFGRTTQLKCDGNSFSHPVDNKRPWNSGVNVYFAAEGATMVKSDPTMLDVVEHKLRKMYAYSEVSNESLEDAAGLSSWLAAKAPEAIVQRMNELIINGSGVGMPTGLLKSGHLYTIAAEAAQVAATVVVNNIIKMMSARIPGGNYVWLYNPALEFYLRSLVNPAGQYVFLASGSQLNNSPYDTLYGLPMMPMIGGVQAIGSVGDIVLVDLNRGYETLTKSGPAGSEIKFAVSPHIAFDKDKQAFKWTIRWDGKCPYNAQVKNQTNDATLSYLIALAARP